MDLPMDRFTPGASVPVGGADPYAGYRFVVTSVRSANDLLSGNSVQFAEIQFDGQVVSSVPEPAVWLLALLALAALAVYRRRAAIPRRRR
jgi:hypothetical protein